MNSPTRVILHDDSVIFLVPSLKRKIDKLNARRDRGILSEPDVKWSICSWNKQQCAISLDVKHDDVQFSMPLLPEEWDLIPKIRDAALVGIIGDKNLVHADGRKVTCMCIDDQGDLKHTLYEIRHSNVAFEAMQAALPGLTKEWNPDGIVTYLASILDR